MKLEIIHKAGKGKKHGTPLLFVHGKWHGAWCWDENFLPFFAEQGYDCTALSLRGHGGSKGKIWGASIADYVDDVAQVAGGLKTAPIMIGHSMGGFITQKYLETHTAPAAVLLTSIPPYGLWPSTLGLIRRHPMAMLKVLTKLQMYPVIETPALAQEVLFSADMPAEKVAAYQKRFNDESVRACMDELGFNLVRTKKVKTPLLVIGAEKDTVISQKAVRDTAKTYGTSAEMFPDMAHDVMLESGWGAVAKRIVEWLGGRGL